MLTVTSYANRTSPVQRGKWVLENLIGHAAAAAAAERAAAEGRAPAARCCRCASAWREHRANPACASCHQLMDPIGLATENFDAVGRWRVEERVG